LIGNGLNKESFQKSHCWISGFAFLLSLVSNEIETIQTETNNRQLIIYIVTMRDRMDSLDLDVEKILWKDTSNPEKAYFFGMMEQQQSKQSSRKRLFYNMDLFLEERTNKTSKSNLPGLTEADTPKKQLKWQRSPSSVPKKVPSNLSHRTKKNLLFAWSIFLVMVLTRKELQPFIPFWWTMMTRVMVVKLTEIPVTTNAKTSCNNRFQRLIRARCRKRTKRGS
jgi:hypothetical protein